MEKTRRVIQNARQGIKGSNGHIKDNKETFSVERTEEILG